MSLPVMPINPDHSRLCLRYDMIINDLPTSKLFGFCVQMMPCIETYSCGWECVRVGGWHINHFRARYAWNQCHFLQKIRYPKNGMVHFSPFLTSWFIIQPFLPGLPILPAFLSKLSIFFSPSQKGTRRPDHGFLLLQNLLAGGVEGTSGHGPEASKRKTGNVCFTRWWQLKYFWCSFYLGKIPILTHIFQIGWNHHPSSSYSSLCICVICFLVIPCIKLWYQIPHVISRCEVY